MQKLLIVFSIVFVFCASGFAQELGYKDLYIGVGGSYAIENFDEVHPLDDSWGFNAKIGYQFHEDLKLQFDFDYLFKFEGDGHREKFKGDVKILTYIFSLKGYFPVNYHNIRPFIIAGGGVMYADADVKSSSGSEPSFAPHETHFCGKLGGGLDWLVSERFTLGLEGNYTVGTKDLIDVRYFHFILGATYHFDL